LPAHCAAHRQAGTGRQREQDENPRNSQSYRAGDLVHG
jgi:hypothetical protein